MISCLLYTSLLATFDGNSEEQLEDIIEQASEVVLEAGAIDVLVADTPALKKDAWAVRGADVYKRQSMQWSHWETKDYYIVEMERSH